MKYLKYFEQASEYEAFKVGDEYITPNVSYIEENAGVMFESVKPLTYNMVDLGLPSGTLWADRNVGAISPEDAGLYFAWGETNGYTIEQVLNKEKIFDSNYSDYFDTNDGGSTFNKYNVAGATLELSNDAAAVNMGSDWRMPTKSDCKELINNTTIEMIDSNEIKGVKFIGKNNNNIFIPLDNSLIYDENNDPLYITNYCWTSSLFEYAPSIAYRMFLDHTVMVSNCPRYFGHNVRGVCNK